MLEFYILSYGLLCDSNLLTKRLELKIDNKDYDTNAHFLKYASKFWMFAAQAMYKVYSRCSMPLIHFTLQEQFRGLSRMGTKMGSVLGTCPAVTTYDRKSKELTAIYKDEVYDMARNNRGIVTLDNYCHVYGSGNISLARDSSYSKCNYTVVALSAYEFKVRPTFKWTYMFDQNTVVASLPMNLLDLLDFQSQVLIFMSFVLSTCWSIAISVRIFDQCLRFLMVFLRLLTWDPKLPQRCTRTVSGRSPL